MAPSVGYYRCSMTSSGGTVASYLPVGGYIPIAFKGKRYKKRLGVNYGSGAFFDARLFARPLPYKIQAIKDGVILNDVSVSDGGYSERPNKFVFHNFAHGSLVASMAWIYSYDYSYVRSFSVTFTIAIPSVSANPSKFHLREYSGYVTGVNGVGAPPMNPAQAYQWFDKTVAGSMSDQQRCVMRLSSQGWNGSTGWRDFELDKSSLYQNVVISAPPEPQFQFKYNELNAYCMAGEFDVYLHPFATGFKTAYVNAINSLPQVASNSLANVAEAIDAVHKSFQVVTSIRSMRATNSMTKTVASGTSFSGEARMVTDVSSEVVMNSKQLQRNAKALAEIADPRQAWLAYRYAYKTSVSDMEEYRTFIQRVTDLALLCDETIPVYGKTKIGEISYSFTGSISLDQLIPKTLAEKLRYCGVEPSLTNMWDMVPYSFIVDWFIDVSDFTGWLEQNNRALDFTVTDTWYSAYVGTDNETVYWRVPATGIAFPSLMVSGNTSTKTWAMRLGDSVCIASK